MPKFYRYFAEMPLRFWMSLFCLAVAGSLIALVPPAPAKDQQPSASAPATQNADPLDAASPDWRVFDKIFSAKGHLNGGVYSIELPRNDLDINIEGMPVPAEAACSTFHFYRCECGKMSVAGEFCLVDYEANDVIDALRAEGFRVAAMGDMFIGVKPRLVILRFQGEARGSDIYKPILQAIRWIGPNRTQHATLTTNP